MIRYFNGILLKGERSSDPPTEANNIKTLFVTNIGSRQTTSRENLSKSGEGGNEASLTSYD
eukprot:1194129-Prorocentrum_minimum.AAC.2